MTLDSKNLDQLTAVVVRNLPADIHDRKRVLVTLHATLPRTYRRREELAVMIKNLQAHERHQMEFSALLSGGTPVSEAKS